MLNVVERVRASGPSDFQAYAKVHTCVYIYTSRKTFLCSIHSQLRLYFSYALLTISASKSCFLSFLSQQYFPCFLGFLPNISLLFCQAHTTSYKKNSLGPFSLLYYQSCIKLRILKGSDLISKTRTTRKEPVPLQNKV